MSVDPLADHPNQVDKSPYAYAWNNPVYYTDPDGRCPNCITGAIGAGVGTLIGGGFELGRQLWKSGKVTSWKAVGGSALQGGVTGGAAGFTGGASLLTSAAVAGGANVVGGTANRAIQGQETTLSNVLTDATVGAVFGAGGKYIGDKAAQLITKNNLIKELSGSGVRHSADDIVGIGKNSSGKVMFMEQGNAKAGLQHIISEHGGEFVQAGISEKNISKFVMQAVLEGNQVGMQGTRPIFETTFKGATHRVAVTVGDNGFVVGANMASKVK